MTTPERLALHKKETDSILRHFETVPLPRSGLVTTVLKTCREALATGKFAAARQEALSALSSVQGLSFIPNQADLVHGTALMYLGATFHGQGELDDALVQYREAETYFGHGYDDLYAQAARCAQVLVLAWQGQTAKADELAAGLEARSWSSAALSELSLRRKAINSRLTAEQAAPAQAAARQHANVNAPPARVHAGGSGAIDVPQTAADQLIPRKLIAVVITLFVMVILAVLFGSMGLGPVAQLAPPALGLVLLGLYVAIERRLKVEIPANCCAVVQHGNDWRVVCQTHSLTMEPPDRVLAFVPLHTYQLTAPKQKIPLDDKKAVELQVALYYSVHHIVPDRATRDRHITMALAAAQEAAPASGGAAPRKPLQPTEVRRAWEKRLNKDITMTLLEVVPKYEPEQLYCDRDTRTHPVCGDLRANLNFRVRRWGLQVDEVRISEYSG